MSGCALPGSLIGRPARRLPKLQAGDTLVQPYVPSVEAYGERSLVWVDGALTHAVRKTPRFGDQDEQVSGMLAIAVVSRGVY